MIRSNKRKGFTLVELLVVIAILAILAATAVVGYTSFIKKANRSNALSELNQIRNVVTTLIIVDGEEIVALESGNNLVFDYDGKSLSAHLENPTDPDATFTE
jgi:prepilin-type N-terminal cleavage/methylation domain-containing protein